MPEVARQESLHQLQARGIVPTNSEELLLQVAVIDRYRDLVARDFNPANQTSSAFRGPERAGINLSRLEKFADANGIDKTAALREAASRFRKYLEDEAREIETGRGFNTLGLPPEQAATLAGRLGLTQETDLKLLEEVNSVQWLDYQAAIVACHKWEAERKGGQGR